MHAQLTVFPTSVMLKSPFVGGVVALFGVIFHATNDFRPLDAYLPPSSINATVEEHFSDTYYQARALFRQRATSATAVLHTLPLEHLADLDLTIDIAVIPGDSDRVLLHMSGTHGVEGFTGSAIQSAILQRASTVTSASGPTVVLVHAVNPFGFSQLRRVNENNVDLNRNWLSTDGFADARAADPNQNGYMDVYDLLNPLPSGGTWKMNLEFLKSCIEIAKRGVGAVKQAMVSATYHSSQGIFFGGFEKQPSLILLEKFLVETIGINKIKHLSVIDVHTGLGPSGVDTIILTPVCNVNAGRLVFAEEDAAGWVAATSDTSNSVTAGYSNSRGYVTDGIVQLVPKEHRHNVLSAAQEFGTVPFLSVLKALIEENAYYQHALTRRTPFAQKLRDVFYIHASSYWRQSVIDRGLSVFKKVYNHASVAL